MGYRKTAATFLVLAGISIWAAVLLFPDNLVHIWICDVGQGDGILIQRRFTQILIDVGPDESITSCLSRHMPFYDQKIDLVLITHPQQDHQGGLSSIANRYSIMQYVSIPNSGEIQIYEWLEEQWKTGKLIVANTFSGDKIIVNGLQLRVIWPTREFIKTHSTEPITRVLGINTDGSDLNGFAIVSQFTYGEFDLLLTADADAQVEPAIMSTGLLSEVEVLKVPHHGSKTGMIPDWLKIVSPQLAVISSGKHNSFGHPAIEALDLLSGFGVKTMRTDQLGDIEIITNGKTYWVK
jgi:competence protein ComEC